MLRSRRLLRPIHPGEILREDGSWVLMRPSGTEPVVRVYCEAASQAELDRLVNAAQAFVINP